MARNDSNETKKAPRARAVVNEHGRRIGKSHSRARLTDREIDLIRELHEKGLSYGQIAEKFEEIVTLTVRRV